MDTGSNPPVPSNEHVSVVGSQSEQSGIAIDGPFIDKLSLTFAVTEHSHQNHIVGVLTDAAQYGEWGFQPAHGKAKAGYAYALWAPLSVIGKMLIQVRPGNSNLKKLPFVRVEANPSDFGPDGIKRFHHCLACLFPNGYTSHARVTRIDAAIDITGVPFQDLTVRSRGHRKTNITAAGDGSIETLYLGVRRSKWQVAVYDKTAELKSNAGVLGAGHCIRFEARIKTGIMLSNLTAISNPFSGIEVYALSGITPPEQPHHLAMFRDSVRYRGLGAALKLLPPNVRKKYDAALSAAKSEHWKPAQLWSAWPTAVETSGLLAEGKAPSNHPLGVHLQFFPN